MRAPTSRGAAAWRWAILLGIALAGLSARACESYAYEYQSFPAVDWLEAHPPLDETAAIPSSDLLAVSLSAAEPDLLLAIPPAPYLPQLAPPGMFQRMVGGVRDATTASFTPSNIVQTTNPAGATVQLHVTVFHRTLRASAWTSVLQTEIQNRGIDARSVYLVTGPTDRDTLWVTRPQLEPAGTGTATLLGYRGPIAFELQSIVLQPTSLPPRDPVELAARAELVAREAGSAWLDWLSRQPFARSFNG